MLPPWLKVSATLAFCALVALLPRQSLEWHLVPTVLLVPAWLRARLPLASALRRLVPVECFLFGLALLVLWRPEAQALFLAAAVKSHLCLLATLLLVHTTAEHEMLGVLRRWRVPALLITLLALLLRYLPLLREESQRMQRARASRTFAPSHRLHWHTLGEIASELFLRSTRRAERIHQAMNSRGWS